MKGCHTATSDLLISFDRHIAERFISEHVLNGKRNVDVVQQ